MSDKHLSQLLLLMQLSDSALPVGGFSFSNTLESAVEYGIVDSEDSLYEFSKVLLQQSATTDGVAALNAHRAAIKSDYQTIIRCDKALYARKINAEQRLMSQRMGRKLAELCANISGSTLLRRYCDDASAAHTYAVVQGVVFAEYGLAEDELFASLCYGTASMVLNAALRCMRITHLQTQRILFSLAPHIAPLYGEIAELDIDNMHSFSLQIDALSALHEKSAKRLFMN